MNDYSIDDMNTTLIKYKGSWEAINGSTKEWDGTVHTTGQAGATATFQFSGYSLRVWGTVPEGTGKNSVQLTIDGGPPNITSHKSNGSAIFNVLYFETPRLSETFHTAIITNLDSTTNGSSEFELDRFEFTTTDATPLFAPPSPVGGGSTSKSMTVSHSMSQTSSTISELSATANARSPSVTSPLAGIAGGIIGTLVLVIVLLVFLLCRRRKSNETIHPIPEPLFRWNYSLSLCGKRSQPNDPEKPDSQPTSQWSSPRRPWISGASSSGSQLPSSNPLAPTRSITPSSFKSSSESSRRNLSFLPYPSITDNGSFIHSPLSSRVNINMNDNPPPSYWYLKQDKDANSGHSTISEVIKPF